ncbi:flagellar motor protein PomA [Marinobacter sp. NSM]|uniref:flagellar motor protein PomA n=1 Tax=Marinobacter sp. NSM TaxID=3458004 RepID=UPI004035C8CC
MDLATIVGLIGALALIFLAILLGASPGTFLNPAGILIVVGGSLFVVLAKFSIGEFLGSFKSAARAFKFKVPSCREGIEEVLQIANIARKEGVLGLEGFETKSEFLGKGIQMLVDGQDANTVQSVLAKEKTFNAERNRKGSKVFSALGDVAPAMGMIGTLIGLVQMLSNMEDPKSIGPAMAVALLTTLYGAMIATMIALPISDKLMLRVEDENRIQSLYLDALIGIQSGTNPRIIEQLLTSYVPPEERVNSGESSEA